MGTKSKRPDSTPGPFMSSTFPRIDVHPVDHCNLACIGCNHAAPHRPKAIHDVSDYRRWLDLLRRKGHTWDTLGISGGEPFLHPDISGFTRALREAYSDSQLEIFSNAFWLAGPTALEDYHSVFTHIDRIMITHYRPVVDRIGWDRILNLEELLRSQFGIEVGHFQREAVHRFAQVAFYEEAIPVTESHVCAVRDCTQLRPNGILYRCTYGHYLETGLTSIGFRHPDLQYDLGNELAARDLREWREKWPLGSCHFCGCGDGRQIWTNWTSDSTIRGMGKPEYNLRVAKLIEQGQ